MTPEKMQALAYINSAMDDLWSAYKEVKNAYEYFSDDDLYAIASSALTTMINLLDVERRLNSNEV